MTISTHHVAAGALLLAAGGLALLATRGAGPVQLTKYVELRRGPLQEHLVSVDELNMGRGFSAPRYPMHYPGTVAAGITGLVKDGFTPLWQIPEPQIAPLPAEQAW